MGMDLDFEKVFRALGDSHRLHILSLLTKKEMNAQEILEAEDVVQSTLSHHMKTLTTSGLVNIRKSGRWSYYTVNTEAVEEAQQYLSQYLTGAGEVQEAAASEAAAQKAPEAVQPAETEAGEETLPDEISAETVRLEKNTSANKSSAENTPAGNTSAENTPAGNTAAENTPAGNTPAENTPAGNTAADNTSGENTPEEKKTGPVLYPQLGGKKKSGGKKSKEKAKSKDKKKDKKKHGKQ